jgi:hypothetical protein
LILWCIVLHQNNFFIFFLFFISTYQNHWKALKKHWSSFFSSKTHLGVEAIALLNTNLIKIFYLMLKGWASILILSVIKSWWSDIINIHNMNMSYILQVYHLRFCSRLDLKFLEYKEITYRQLETLWHCH